MQPLLRSGPGRVTPWPGTTTPIWAARLPPAWPAATATAAVPSMWTRWPGCARSQIISAPDPRRSPAKTGPAAGQVRFLRAARPHFLQTKKDRTFHWEDPVLLVGAGWIRTTEALSSRFTVCPHWPLGNTPLFCFLSSGRIGWRLVYFTTASGVCQLVFSDFLEAFSLPAGAWLLCAAGLLASTACLLYHPDGVLSRPISILFALRPRVCGSVTNFFIPLVFFQAVFYNSDIGTGGARGFCAPARPFAKRPLADPSDPSG